MAGESGGPFRALPAHQLVSDARLIRPRPPAGDCRVHCGPEVHQTDRCRRMGLKIRYSTGR